MNTLYFGDNLDILQKHVPDESVDPIGSCHTCLLAGFIARQYLATVALCREIC
ncbi:MAG: hypothetical protein NT023_12140 [Armatimonadetes bacterium]|nr:hypothetical protein [Armatimonadota bacterium]